MCLKTTTAAVLFLVTSVVSAQTDVLRKKIRSLIDTRQANVGIAIIGPFGQDTLTVHGRHRYPMQSTYKFPLALAVFHQIDQGQLRLDQTVHVTKADMLPTYSPLREQYPEGNVDVTVQELLKYTVTYSDNNACDILFRLIGGTAVADRYIHSLGIADMAIVATEEEMSRAWDVQYTNWTTPVAMAKMLTEFYEGKHLAAGSRAVLWKMMVATVPGAQRLKGRLPAGTTVGHRTGTSNTNEQGLTAAVNDVGVVVLPDGRTYTIVVLVSDSHEKPEVNEKIIADISKATWDHFTSSPKRK
ncbi:class A beta-lactamase, subclass A2 [Dawidia soli]|uniref:beta-lactamase n=1 Tax=Dawidia soli TaxID=2782352 RepID=A0AAP2D6F9_9BACT|nr:class A beta-lactamase, subclass A2 [Dawidia soli]MBT1684930.1 class A beta-lactamase, subclass A2 [Dawidia soli]